MGLVYKTFFWSIFSLMGLACNELACSLSSHPPHSCWPTKNRWSRELDPVLPAGAGFKIPGVPQKGRIPYLLLQIWPQSQCHLARVLFKAKDVSRWVREPSQWSKEWAVLLLQLWPLQWRIQSCRLGINGASTNGTSSACAQPCLWLSSTYPWSCFALASASVPVASISISSTYPWSCPSISLFKPARERSSIFKPWSCLACCNISTTWKAKKPLGSCLAELQHQQSTFLPAISISLDANCQQFELNTLKKILL